MTSTRTTAARLYPTVISTLGNANENVLRQMMLASMGLAPMPIRQRLIHGVDALGTLRAEVAVLACPLRGVQRPEDLSNGNEHR